MRKQILLGLLVGTVIISSVVMLLKPEHQFSGNTFDGGCTVDVNGDFCFVSKRVDAALVWKKYRKDCDNYLDSLNQYGIDLMSKIDNLRASNIDLNNLCCITALKFLDTLRVPARTIKCVVGNEITVFKHDSIECYTAIGDMVIKGEEVALK